MAIISLQLPKYKYSFSYLRIDILCSGPDSLLSSIAQVCNALRPLSTVEDLYIEHRHLKLVLGDDAVENTAWLRLLLPFIAVKNLYLSNESAPAIAAARQELVRARKIEELPNLQNILVKGLDPSGSLQGNFSQFVASRRLSGRPVTISVLDKLWDD